MRKIFIISLIVFLIFSTAIIKNSTKRIDDEIFIIKGNLRNLEKDLENIKLEYDYLSSSERLLEFQNLYFNNELTKKDIQKIKVIIKLSNKIKLEKLNFIDEK